MKVSESKIPVVCEACGKMMDVRGTIREFKQGDLVVQFFGCDHCGKLYHVLTTNSELRALIAKRKELELKIQIGYQRKYKAEIIRAYIQQIDEIKKKQIELGDGLKVVGEQFLDGLGKVVK